MKGKINQNQITLHDWDPSNHWKIGARKTILREHAFTSLQQAERLFPGWKAQKLCASTWNVVTSENLKDERMVDLCAGTKALHQRYIANDT